jgi:hypothetical protein
MKNKRGLKKLCTEFVVLNDVEKDYILGISQALEFAVKKPKKMTKTLPHIDGTSDVGNLQALPVP